MSLTSNSTSSHHTSPSFYSVLPNRPPPTSFLSSLYTYTPSGDLPGYSFLLFKGVVKHKAIASTSFSTTFFPPSFPPLPAALCQIKQHKKKKKKITKFFFPGVNQSINEPISTCSLLITSRPTYIRCARNTWSKFRYTEKRDADWRLD